ncbi:Pyridoxal-5'-phosphate phosphatase [Candidatus Rhodobacter oscarellae]|uniref:Pyridoxal-5'-phosphate phosphatase n=1 Tax=Candidatus Rhodobacter oscarellae TaxID=1675527 RepID=A0A0J9E1K6_9RHOB|nr:pyrimidine 5'-nucleotidase [Candidatus Rhodobacter lobularis]KMW56776.1 Pyridoxal-5'-phosphate phosphatase [Candidatus Rhodobacter lobularis]
MPHRAFQDVTTWVFDLDNTLYPPSADLFGQMERRMEAWITARLGVPLAEAQRMRKVYWAEHGTTLAGLMAEHDIDPWDFLGDVHDIDMSPLDPEPALARSLAALPGRRIVYTNGDAPYARRVLAARGLEGAFHAVYGIEHAGWQPKPTAAAFDAVFAADGLDPTRAAMFEDDPRNLLEPHRRGLRTVHVAPQRGDGAAHVHFHTDDLAGFLSQLLVGMAAGD